MAIIYLLLGSNLGNKIRNLSLAEELIGENIGKLRQKSSLYQSPPWGFDHKEDFLNQVLQIESEYSPERVLEKIIEIEKYMGRKRPVKSGLYLPRIIDVDILFYNDLIQETPSLTIPHPQLHLRRFTLIPLNEIAPDFIHPVLKLSVHDLLESCYDRSKVKQLQF
jgi:2-amino-4-hydroxy-6-hydroxymethyldihydropteridine diphosphokinase